MENVSVSQLRKKTHTQNQAPHPVLMTLKYDIEQVKLLIQLSIDAGIRICTRVDIITPNGLFLSEDFTLTPAQIREVWQKRPEIIQLNLKPPENLTKYLSKTFIVDVNLDGLLIDQVNADYYLARKEKISGSEDITQDNNKEKQSFFQDAISNAVLTRILPQILPDSSQEFTKPMRWKCFLLLKEALIQDGATKINIDIQSNKEHSTISGIDCHQGDIFTTYKAFRERLKNLVKVYKSI